jgi:Domain of unknown function (DUF4129)
MRKANTSAATRRSGRVAARHGLALAALLLLGRLAVAAPPVQQPTQQPAPPAAPAPAAKPVEPPATDNAAIKAWPLPPDRTTLLPARQPDEARLRELRADSDFQYAEAAPEGMGLWDRFWYWVGRLLVRLLGTPGGRLTWQYGWYAAIVAALVFGVLKLLKVDLTGAFGRSARRTGLNYDVLAEDIHGVDFPARLAEAEAAGNYRLAVRLGYLEALKLLSDQGLLLWEPNKTNHAYLQELPAGALREAFRVATRQFEYVWYGELPLTAAQYQPVRAAQRAVRAAVSSTSFAAAR